MVRIWIANNNNNNSKCGTALESALLQKLTQRYNQSSILHNGSAGMLYFKNYVKV